MAPSDTHHSELDDIPQAELVQSKSGLSIAWFLPILALLIGGWLVYKTLSEQGPLIQISFDTAEGIEVDKTRIKYRDVDIGEVTSVRYAADLSHVIIEVRLQPGGKVYLKESSRFWVVRPRIGTQGISGLGTLISGAYIAVDPGTEGETTHSFSGLENPPGITSETEGSIYHLRSSKLGSLNIGSPVYFRQIPIGEIVAYELTEDHKHVDISAFIRAPHDKFVRSNTQFWNVAGLNVELDTEGLNLKMESLIALLSGGVAFETPTNLSTSDKAPKDTVFHLYDTYAQTKEIAVQEKIAYVMYFNDTVRGLNIGAPVEFRGIRVGTVTDIGLILDEQTEKLRIPVLIDFEPSRIQHFGMEKNLPDEERTNLRRALIERLVKRGLRARLQTGNLITGQLFIDFDFFPDSKPTSIIYDATFPELPTTPRPLLGIMTSASKLLSKLEQLPLEEIGGDIRTAAKGLSQFVNNTELLDMIRNLQLASKNLRKLTANLDTGLNKLVTQTSGTLKKAEKTLSSFQEITDKDAPIGRQMYRALEQVADAARSIRIMAEYLERHPEALLQGKQR